MKTITYLQAQSIIDVACENWKKNLAQRWAAQIVFRDNIEISDEFYKQMREACTTEQHKLFDSIFGVDSKLPMKYDDFCFEQGYFIDTEGKITQSTLGYIKKERIFPTKEWAKAILAFTKLLQLQAEWNKGVGKGLFVIGFSGYDDFRVYRVTSMNETFSFKNKETADLFLTTFKELFNDAKPLFVL